MTVLSIKFPNNTEFNLIYLCFFLFGKFQYIREQENVRMKIKLYFCC